MRRRILIYGTFLLLPWLLAAGFDSAPLIQLQEEGTSQGQVSKLNCVGSAVTCARSGVTGTITVSASGGVTRVTQTTDVATTSNAAYSAVSGLSIAVSASTNYTIMCNILTSTAVGTTGLQLQVTGPTSPTEITITRQYHNNSTTTYTPLTATAFNTASTDDAAAGSCAAQRCLNPVMIVLRNGANGGTVAFAVQSEVSASNVTLHRGSYCDYSTW